MWIILIFTLIVLPAYIFIPYLIINRLNNAAGRISLLTYLVRVFILSFSIGLLGFLAGFLGPLIFAPTANQVPLLGIFITGPSGVLLGVIFSWVWLYRATKNT
jgi:hypothetical protein